MSFTQHLVLICSRIIHSKEFTLPELSHHTIQFQSLCPMFIYTVTRLLYTIYFQVIWKVMYSPKSTAEHCTLYQIRDLINRRNDVKKPIDSFNACDDFLMTVLVSHIIAAAMDVLHINRLELVPPDSIINDAQNLWMKTEKDRKAVLKHICGKIV